MAHGKGSINNSYAHAYVLRVNVPRDACSWLIYFSFLSFLCFSFDLEIIKQHNWMRLLSLIFFKVFFSTTRKPVSPAKLESLCQPLLCQVRSGKVIPGAFWAPRLEPGTGACLTSPRDGFESTVRGQGEGCPGQAGRTLPLHFDLNDLFLNFLITKGESYPFKVTNGPDYLKKTRSIHRRAF